MNARETNFVHLRTHSEYSLADGVLRVKELAKAVADHQMPAVALTDRTNLFALVKFYTACLKQGVKPIIGSDVQFENAEGELCGVTLLAQNDEGYANLIQIVSGAYLGERHGLVTREVVFERHAGLIILSGGRHGDVGRAIARGDMALAQSLASQWQQQFGDRYYLELCRTGRAGEESYVRAAVTLAAASDIAVVATNEVCFLAEDDYEAHETRVCIHEGRVLDDPRRERRYAPTQYLCSGQEMAERFADLPAALENTVAIAQRCSATLSLGTYYLPNYPVPEGQTLEEFLLATSIEGLEQRFEARPLAVSKEVYRERLDYELGVINQMGFAGYFLIVMEFIAWSRDNNIPVGPGRGSGAGSLVAYVLGITDLDPLAYELLFERFLNPERVSMPDFDVDFCMEGRDKVIAHVSDLYGSDAVSQIITFGTMAAKAVVRDVARVQGKPYGLADKLSKLIPFEVGMTLTKAVDETAELVQFINENEEVAEIMEMAYKLEGIVRNVGRHAGGVVIAPSRLTDFVPLYVDEGSSGLVSQFDKDDVESAGLVKFDFLGLKTLTVIDWAVASINARSELLRAEQAAQGEALDTEFEPLNIENIPLEDAATFQLLRAAETTGVFQLESRGMKDLIRRLLPDGINDIIALVALFRPGPLQSGAVDDYIDRKHGRAAVTFPHPTLDEVLGDTYGVVLYQEQVMQVAQVLAGFTLGQADLLRRAMGKKKPEEMAKVRKQFVSGAVERGVDETLTNEIFDLMEKFAGYAFNKSHSATYALVSFQTAWLKCHHPAHFMAATLSADMQNTDKVVTLVDETRRMGLTLQPPSVNASEFRFSAAPAATPELAGKHPNAAGLVVLYGLGAVRGVGEGPVEAIVEAREQGPFVSLADFCKRVDARKANKRVLEALIRSGAMDELLPVSGAEVDLDQVRAQLLADVPAAVKGADQAARDSQLGITDLFGGVGADGPESSRVELCTVAPLTQRERLSGEKDTLGLYLTGHPIQEYLPELRNFAKGNIANLRAGKRNQILAGLVVSMRTMRNKRGGMMGFAVLDDRSGRIEASLFSDVFEKEQHKLCEDAIVVLEGDVQQDDFSGAMKFKVNKVYTMEESRRRFSGAVVIDFLDQPSPSDLPARLKRCLEPHRLRDIGCPVAVWYRGDQARAQIALGNQWHVSASDDLLRNLRNEFDGSQVSLSYGKAQG